jgi:hypothetical protein
LQRAKLRTTSKGSDRALQREEDKRNAQAHSITTFGMVADEYIER